MAGDRQQQPQPQQSTVVQQQQREVASGVVNLGNTCYMNAVLQALAHAPELCLALDYENHRSTCPIARNNEERRRNSPTPISGDETVVKKRPASLRKSRRSGGKKSPTTDSEDQSVEMEFCTLCELEGHLAQVHQSQGDPVAPDTFVNGFVERVAPPWFKLGVQEDSHEFLRLLIDAMQNSCRPKGASPAPPVVSDQKQKDDENDLYPFKLFRGTVESNVSCDACQATSATIDPIEDIGLEVTHTSGALSDLSSAFCRFTKAEPLTGYKCDRCNKAGGATKQSRLASIPPILTLHLKRFRYGSDGRPLPPPPARRGGREVSQLLGSSGSAKIEGHVKFLEFFDLKPFLTKQLAANVKSMFCRLFSVIVHAGKNSHSGHYVAYVRNLNKNEWWKMDDARVSRVSSQEVLSAEAYMLFYRVVDHPVAQQLRAKKAAAAAKGEEEEKRKREVLQEAKKMAAAAVVVTSSDNTATNNTTVGPTTRKRKREATTFRNGEEWARAKTRLPPSFAKILRRAEEFISDNIEFTPEFFKVIMDEAAKKNGTCPSSGCEENVQGGVERFRPGLLELIYKLASQANVEGDFLLKGSSGEEEAEAAPKPKEAQKPLIVPVVDANDPFL